MTGITPIPRRCAAFPGKLPGKRLPSVVVRAEYVAICNGDRCAAAILSAFECWTVGKRRHYQKRAEAAGRKPNAGDSIWIYKTRDELYLDLNGIFGRAGMLKSLMLVTALGYLDKRKNPHNGQDQTLQYRFDGDTVQAALDLLASDLIRPTYQNDTPEVSESHVQRSPENVEDDESTRTLPEESLHKIPPEITDIRPAAETRTRAHTREAAAAADIPEASDMQTSLHEEAQTLAPGGSDPIPPSGVSLRSTTASGPLSPSPRTVAALYAHYLDPPKNGMREIVAAATGKYTPEWAEYAFAEAITHDALNWPYIEAILERQRKQAAEAEAAQADVAAMIADSEAAREAPAEPDIDAEMRRRWNAVYPMIMHLLNPDAARSWRHATPLRLVEGVLTIGIKYREDVAYIFRWGKTIAQYWETLHRQAVEVCFEVLPTKPIHVRSRDPAASTAEPR
jgi:hypothetical protein